MKQILQSPRTGEAVVDDLPAPMLRPGFVHVRTARSLISAGTERTMVDFARKSLLEKARSRPDLARKVWDKARRDGILAALDSALSRLDQPQALGYAASGTVLDVGEGITDLRVGQRVACAGSGYASHAEILSVPRNLVAEVPDDVSMDAAAFATVGAIGLHGIRLARPTVGETFVVVGLGLIGLLSAQILRASGCRVIGSDLDPERAQLGRELGLDEVVVPGDGDLRGVVDRVTGGVGADGVLITASTPGNGPVQTAADVCRDRGRVVAVGAVGMDLDRKPFYEKELEFRVSRSYGPGRYDPVYEEGGVDYPVGYVRWTEGRNLDAFLDLVQRRDVRVEPLVTHRIPIAEAGRAYDLLVSGGDTQVLAILLEYPESGDPSPSRRVELSSGKAASRADTIAVGAIGAGNFAVTTLFPAMKAVDGITLRTVCSAGGTSSVHAAKKFGFSTATTDEKEVLGDPEVDLVAVLTRHDLHAKQVVRALESGKHVYTEKPLCLSKDELAEIVKVHQRLETSPLLMVGFNRRFAPMVRRLADFLPGSGGPLNAHYRVNAGRLPPDHWLNDPDIGGGRIIGEGCHFIDLITFLADADPVRVFGARFGAEAEDLQEDVSLILEYADGSVATITYAASGASTMPKEYLEVIRGGRSAILNNFRELVLYDANGRTRDRARFRQDKGHRREWEALSQALRDSGEPPIPLRQVVSTTLASFAAVDSLSSGVPVEIDVDRFLAGVVG